MRGASIKDAVDQFRKYKNGQVVLVLQGGEALGSRAPTRFGTSASDFGIAIDGAVRVGHENREDAKGQRCRPIASKCRMLTRTLDGCTVYEGNGRFVGPKTVQVGDAELHFINVGGSAALMRKVKPRIYEDPGGPR